MRKLYKRKWLNPSGTAFIEAKFSDCSDEYGASFDGDIKIADCSRIVNLELHSWNFSEGKQRVDKLRLIRDTMDECLDWVEGWYSELPKEGENREIEDEDEDDED